VCADYHVRRRRYHDTTFLIRHNEYFGVDALTDAVWLGCERGATVGEIIASVAQRLELPLDEAVAGTAVTLERFRALGFVSYEPEALAAEGGDAQA
jgi:hypothetical protein